MARSAVGSRNLGPTLRPSAHRRGTRARDTSTCVDRVAAGQRVVSAGNAEGGCHLARRRCGTREGADPPPRERRCGPRPSPIPDRASRHGHGREVPAPTPPGPSRGAACLAGLVELECVHPGRQCRMGGGPHAAWRPALPVDPTDKTRPSPLGRQPFSIPSHWPDRRKSGGGLWPLRPKRGPGNPVAQGVEPRGDDLPSPTSSHLRAPPGSPSASHLRIGASGTTASYNTACGASLAGTHQCVLHRG